MKKRIIVISDNLALVNAFHNLTASFKSAEVTYFCSPQNILLLNDATLSAKTSSVNIKTDWHQLNCDLIFSLHCKQFFPAELVRKIPCINVHPGLNPYNRGWFPQVFSILNGMKAGATIHEIDEQLDHGAIIAQKEIIIEKWDTSLTAYNKIQAAEIELLKENLPSILEGNYKSNHAKEEGNVNLKKDFNALCVIDLEKQVTMNEAIDYLRAMTHGHYKNAYFIDKETEKKVFVSIDLKPESENY